MHSLEVFFKLCVADIAYRGIEIDNGRRTQGLFVCPHCGEYNADLNGAINIGKKFERHLGYMPLCGAECEPALNHAEKSMEAIQLVGW